MSVATHRRPALTTTAAASLLAVVTTLGAAAPTHAADDLEVAYDASGSTYVAKTKSTAALGPGTLSAALNPADGTFTGHLVLPPTRTSFRALGLLPTTATVGFREAAPITGRLNTVGGVSTVQSTATYIITLRDIKVVGFPAFEGPNCQTRAPVVIPANTPSGERFDLTTGGTLTGSYPIGRFQNCGFATGLLNLLVPGPNNTVQLTVSNGRIVG